MNASGHPLNVWNSAPQWPWPCGADIKPYLHVPGYYLTGYDEVRGFIRGLSRGRVLNIGKSAGGRDLTVVYYGPEKPVRKLCVTASTHGTEVEGVAALANIMKVFETGRDLRGRKWPQFSGALKKVGFYLMPFFNPDGAARAVVKSYVGMPYDRKNPARDLLNHLHVGFWKNGKTLSIKQVFRRWHAKSDLADRLDRIAYLGARFNDSGVDPNRPCSARATTSVETRCMAAFLKQEKIDCYLDIHSFSWPPLLSICAQEHMKGDYRQLVALQTSVRESVRKSYGLKLEMGFYKKEHWFNSCFFPYNLGIYAFTYEEQGGFAGIFPKGTPAEKIWLANTYNGMHVILGMAQGLLQAPAVWR